ncbi:MAG: YbaB/EbfC family nucleoid-associated protein [Planctomycetes bacterium]|nr:YbaB/EbfC family nucleoid-associated protein [Planctomycetota bacterium]
MDIRHLLEQAKNLEKAVADLDERLKSHVTEGTGGGGAVRVAVNGQGDVLDLRIDPELIATGDTALVRDTLLAALRQATSASRAYREEQKAQLTGGLKLPEF